MEKYILEQIKSNVSGGKGTSEYIVKNYDGNKEALKQQLEEQARFWENYYIKEYDDKVIVEKETMSLD